MNYSKIISPLELLRSKIPLFILTVQMSITNLAFNTCPNSIVPFLIYFPILSILCLIYEGLHCYVKYNKIKNKSKKWLIIVCSTIISYISFFSVSYYIPGGKPFSCYSGYNSVTSTLIFYLSFCIVYTYSYIEHHFLLNDNSDDIDNMGIELTSTNSNSSNNNL
jgi:hypothetical protein